LKFKTAIRYNILIVHICKCSRVSGKKHLTEVTTEKTSSSLWMGELNNIIAFEENLEIFIQII
jgi:uncharacterized membrane protein YcaP (DUF421 family)